MTGVLITLLVIAVIVLWSRVNSLGRALDEINRAIRELKRSAVARPPVDRANEPAAEPQQIKPSVLPSTPRPAWNPPSAPKAEPESTPFDWLAGVVRDYFTGGNLVVRVGVIVLFFGVAFLLTYVAQRTQISMQMRLSGVAVGAAGLFVLGWTLRHRRRGFALALQGGAIGVMYLTLFAALRLYALVSPQLAFVLMAALGVISCLLALRQDAMAMSMLGATGGFLAPVLASTAHGSHEVLFGYYALLDAFIVAQAWFKTWRPLNLLAFVFTFGVGTAWGVMRYEPALFATTEPFLLFFFLAFIAIAILFAFRRAPRLAHYVDGTLVFGTPVVALALQMQLVRDFHHGRAWSALGAGVLYLLLAGWLHHFQRDTLRLLKDSFLALGVAFLTLAVPLWFDDTWTSATWALEGAALMWVGLRQGRWLPTTSGVLLQLAAAATFVLRSDVSLAQFPVVNTDFIGALIISIAGLLSARVAARADSILKAMGQLPSHLLLAWGLGWWLYAGGNEISVFVPAAWDSGACLGLCALTALACGALVRPLAWSALRVPALLLLPVMLAAAMHWRMQFLHPASEGGWLAWPMAFAVLWSCLRWHERSLQATVPELMHGFTAWLLGLLLSWELAWHVERITATGSVWPAAAWALAPTVMLAVLASRFVSAWWPMRDHQDAFRQWVASGLAAFLLVWSVWLDFSFDGAAAGLPYLPLLNPLDIAEGLALLAIAGWLAMAWRAGTVLFTRGQIRTMVAILVVAAFIWLNGILLRTMHLWTGVHYNLGALAADTSVQAALSIFWTLLALGAMLWANRTALRAVWFGGAALMGVVVLKLFLVDLARVGTLPRIVSFLVVGGLMLVIGYFSPLPPATKGDAVEASKS